MMPSVLHIAVFTVRQWRGTSVLLLLYLALIIPALIPSSTAGGEIVYGIGTFGGVLFASFLGAVVVQREVESRTVFAILAKPITREAFFAGKFLGGLLLLAAYWCTLIVTAGALGWLNHQAPGELFRQCAVLSALNMYLYYTIACGLAGVVGVVGGSGLTLFLGFSIGWVRDLTQGGPAMVRALSRVCYWLLPAYDQLVFAGNLQFHTPAPSPPFLLLTGDTFLYATTVFVVACLSFGRRSITR